MTKKGILASTLAFILMGQGETKENRALCSGYLPPNKLSIPVGAMFMGELTGITAKQFNDILDRIEKLYGDEIKRERKANFVVKRNWVGDVVNAYATQTDGGKTWSIHMFGGLARSQGMTDDGFAAVACHEVGHHVGGAPKFSNSEDVSPNWGTIEGEADYYAMLKCLRRYFEFDDNEKILAGMKLDPHSVKSCSEQFGNRRDAQICMRAAEAGIVLGKVLQQLGGEQPVSLGTPDSNKANGIDESHPRAQCRLDTYYTASICPVPVWERRSDTDVKAGSCHDQKLTARGLRPRCWYNPKS
jgi:hypothetical protein